MATWTNCGACGGTGQYFDGADWRDENCHSCRGEGKVKVTSKAKRGYRCALCRETIPAGTEYVPVDLTPWTCHPDGDKVFARLHHHKECNRIFHEVAHLHDYEYPPDADCWRQMVETYRTKLAQPEVQIPLIGEGWF